MKISRFQFEDKSLGWKLDELLLDKLTLLVGASGVGKTQILKSLMSLKDVANGASVNGIKWHIEFETLDKKGYIWEGEFEENLRTQFSLFETYEFENKKSRTKIITERLLLNHKVIIDRTPEGIIFNGKPTVKLSQQQSVLNLLKEEELVKPAYDSLKKLYLVDYSDFADTHRIGIDFDVFSNIKKLMKKYNSLKKIQESNLDIFIKLFFLSQVDTKTFELIKVRFIDIFPKVDDIRVAPIERKEKIPFLENYPIIQIKEKGVKNWITPGRISSGMLRTLLQLSELYLCAEGTVFLIDEFENSLGINCINEVINDILTSKRQLQFILTSHHPYIINAIDVKNWKLVTRNGGIVKTHNVDKFGIGKSKHDTFMQLLQLEEYQTGQEDL